MTSRATVFDIPHLLDLICLHLNQKDLSNCVRVSKTWFSIYTNAFWASCQIHQSALLSTDQRNTILEHAHLLRSLDTEVYTGAFLASHGSSCTRLQGLMIQRKQQQSTRGYRGYRGYRRWSPPEPPSGMTGNLTAYNLIAKNPELQLLQFDLGSLSHSSTKVALAAISNHPSLRGIKVGCRWERYSCMSDRNFLKHIPSTLQELEVSHVPDWASRRVSVKDSAELFSWSKYDIRRLHCFGGIFSLIVDRCPDLVDLALTGSEIEDPEWTWTALIQNCPKLESIELLTPVVYDLALRLIQGLDHLRVLRFKIRVPGSFSYPHALIPTVVAQAGSSLEILDFMESIRLSKKDICHVLKSCPRLKYLKIGPGKYLDRPSNGHGHGLQDLLETPWACTRLEVLDVRLTDFMIEGQDQSSVFILLVRRLQSMGRLTQVVMKWGDSKEEGVGLKLDQGEIIKATLSELRGTLVSYPTLALFLLQNCPRMVSMEMRRAHDDDSASALVRDMVSFDWACKDLRTLQLAVSDDEDGDTFAAMDTLFETLTMLPRLSKVGLDWEHQQKKSRFDITFKDEAVSTISINSSDHLDLARHATKFCLERYPRLKSLSHGVIPLMDLVSPNWTGKTLQVLRVTVQDTHSNILDSCSAFGRVVATLSELPLLETVSLTWRHGVAETRIDLTLVENEVTDSFIRGSGRLDLVGHAIRYCLTHCPRLKSLSAANVHLEDLWMVDLPWICHDITTLRLGLLYEDRPIQADQDKYDYDYSDEQEAQDTQGSRPSSSCTYLSFFEHQQQKAVRMIAELVSRFLIFANLVDQHGRFKCSLALNSPIFKMSLEKASRYMEDSMRLTPRLVEGAGLGWKSEREEREKAKEMAKERMMQDWISRSGIQVHEVHRTFRYERSARYSDDVYYSNDFVYNHGQEEPFFIQRSVAEKRPFRVPRKILDLYDGPVEEEDRPEEVVFAHYKSRGHRRRLNAAAYKK